jgi:hypothetical protein
MIQTPIESADDPWNVAVPVAKAGWADGQLKALMSEGQSARYKDLATARGGRYDRAVRAVLIVALRKSDVARPETQAQEGAAALFGWVLKHPVLAEAHRILGTLRVDINEIPAFPVLPLIQSVETPQASLF